ncbi:MAG: phosphatidate cytidylyltransferase [Deltaproteobacteria bacterium]|nr:phosphatidate cytidylyltransferase [Deltaproteobacteria bacterium]
MLKLRVIAALCFTPPFLFLVWYGGLPLRIGCAVVATIMLWEFYRLTLGKGLLVLKSAGFILAMAFAIIAMDLLPLKGIIFGAPLAFMLLFFVTLLRPDPINEIITSASLVLFGAFYAGGLLPYLVRLRDLPNGLALALMALFCTWGSDTAAYFSGRAFGKHKLYPKISPKKSVEGLIGGVAAAIAVAFLVAALPKILPSSWHSTLHLNSLFNTQLNNLYLILIGFIAAIVGLIGDFCESLLKRSVGAKDSSELIPGHGGILDRFDAVMFVAPALYLFAIAFGLQKGG